MTTLLAVVISLVGAASPGASDSMLTGSELHRHGLLLAQAPPFPEALPPPPSGGRYDGWSRQMLTVELARLDDLRPSLAMPIVLLSVGGTVALLGVTLALVSLIPGLVALIAGAGCVVIGAILLFERVPERRRANIEIEEIEALLERSPSQPSYPQPSNVPPPQVQGPTPSLLLAVL